MSELSTATAALTLAATEMKDAKESFELVRENTNTQVTEYLTNAEERIVSKEEDVNNLLLDADARVGAKEIETDNFLLAAHDRIRNTPFEIDLRGLDLNLYYPVLLNMSNAEPIDLKIHRSYASDRDEEASYGGLFLHVIATGGSWGGNPITMKVISNEQTYHRTAGAIGFGGYSHPMVFLKGGYLYHGLSSQSEQSVQILTEQTTYYEHESDSKYNLTAGPTDDSEIDASDGVLAMSSSFVDLGRANISKIGGYAGTQ